MSADGIPNRVRVGVHEAGHSVVSRIVGLPSGEATIKDGEARSYLTDDHGIRSILVALAGGCAEKILLGDVVELGCKDDDAKVVRLLAANGFTDTTLTRRALADECRDLVRKHRGAIAEVALQLLIRETLTADELNDIVGQTTCTDCA
jgi:hypothetical protein